MDGATHEKGGRICAGLLSGDRGGREHVGSSLVVWAAAGHRAQDAGVLPAVGLSPMFSAQEAQPLALRRRY